MKTENDTIEKVSSIIKNSVMLKLVTIMILTLLLLIPASMVESLIQERKALNEQATQEVSAKWAERQQVNGPILSIPVVYEYAKDGNTTTIVKYWNILPDQLKVAGEIAPERLKRGIYEVVVYKSKIQVSGEFLLDEKPPLTNLKEIQYENAFLTIGISDLRGIKNQIALKWNGANYGVTPGSKLEELVYSGVTVTLPNLESSLEKPILFDFSIDLQGSGGLSFVPLGNHTEVNLVSIWSAPSFNGNFLPDNREVNEDGFNASWSILQLNRNFPQSWLGNENMEKIQDASFGVELLLPLDDYQKSMRSAKYAIMTIALTFLIFFLVEILNGRKIHPFQYALVGFGLCLFYTLLMSISEHTSFNIAYGIAAFSIVAMITLYAASIFKSPKLTLLLMATISGIYGFLFVTLQLSDYALLLGSAGLTFILGLTMYFTRNINWYKLKTSEG
jgi:inner membrane protein